MGAMMNTTEKLAILRENSRHGGIRNLKCSQSGERRGGVRPGRAQIALGI